MSFQFPCCPCAGALCAKHTRNTKRQSPCAILARDPSPYVRKPRNLSTKRNHNSWIAHPHPTRRARAFPRLCAHATTSTPRTPAQRARDISLQHITRERDATPAHARHSRARDRDLTHAVRAIPRARTHPSAFRRPCARSRRRARAIERAKVSDETYCA